MVNPEPGTVIRIEDFIKMTGLLQKSRGRNDKNRLIMCLGIAFALQIFGSLLGGELKDYMWNISAGFYAAGMIYWFVERDYQKQKDELDIAEKLAVYGQRMMQVANSSE